MSKKSQQKKSILEELEDFVRRHFLDDVFGIAHVCYFLALPRLEKLKQMPPGKPVYAGLDEWVREAGFSKPAIKKALLELAKRGLIEYAPGTSRGHATSVRRILPKELESALPSKVLKKFIPQVSDGIASDLRRIQIPWGGGFTMPGFNTNPIGRIFSASPHNIQNETEASIRKNLIPNIAPDEILVNADIKSAEPSMILWALLSHGLAPRKKDLPDIYNEVASRIDTDRDSAKSAVFKVFYGKGACRVPSSWDLPRGHYLFEIMEVANSYRDKLWEDGGKKGYVKTLQGREIWGPTKGKPLTKGRILAWQAQGSVADVFNPRLIDILNHHNSGNLRFFIQQYDGVYVAVKKEGGMELIQGIMSKETENLPNLQLNAKFDIIAQGAPLSEPEVPEEDLFSTPEEPVLAPSAPLEPSSSETSSSFGPFPSYGGVG
jgi:hypothetical protein